LKHCVQSAEIYIGATDPKNSDLPEIDATCGDLPAMSNKAWNALIKANDPPKYFVYGGNLIRIEKTDGKQPTIKILTENRLRYPLARVADWYKPKKNHDKKPTYPPLAVVKDMLAEPNPPLPALRRIIEAPMFAKDGELIITPGYHSAAEVYYSPRVNFAVTSIPEQPSAQEIEAARNLMSDVLIDFPFVSVQERANAFGLMVLPFVRDLIDGSTPLHLIDKPSPGTGASLLAEILIYPSIGRPLPVLTEAREDDEWRKRITAMLITGPGAILIDNIRKPLESSALASAITAREWEDRLF
jgi:putative DNA primase/helicase